MTSSQAVRLVEITKKKANELFDDLIAELQAAPAPSAPPPAEAVAASDPAGPSASELSPEVWMLDTAPPSGDWEEVGRVEGVTYKWPDGNVDHYVDFVQYRGSGGFAGMKLALGHLENGDVVGFVLGSGGGSKRGITYFFPADDFSRTNEKVSMIRGGGPKGRSGFRPDEATPSAYADFRIDILRDRKTGKWNVQAVVVDASDFDAMLRHTAIQARLRDLV